MLIANQQLRGLCTIYPRYFTATAPATHRRIADTTNCIYNLKMITYDENKRQLNLKQHHIDFMGCDAVFAGFTLTREDKRENYGEIRFQTLGLWNDVVVFIVHTPRGEHEHIISIRKAEKHEQRIYWQHYPN